MKSSEWPAWECGRTLVPNVIVSSECYAHSPLTMESPEAPLWHSSRVNSWWREARTSVWLHSCRPTGPISGVTYTTDWEQQFASNGDLYSWFIERLNILYNECFPLRQVSRKRQRDQPWITKGLKISIKYKNKFYKTALTKSPEYIYARYMHYQKNSTVMYKTSREHTLLWNI